MRTMQFETVVFDLQFDVVCIGYQGFPSLRYQPVIDYIVPLVHWVKDHFKIIW